MPSITVLKGKSSCRFFSSNHLLIGEKKKKNDWFIYVHQTSTRRRFSTCFSTPYVCYLERYSLFSFPITIRYTELKADLTEVFTLKISLLSSQLQAQRGRLHEYSMAIGSWCSYEVTGLIYVCISPITREVEHTKKVTYSGLAES